MIPEKKAEYVPKKTRGAPKAKLDWERIKEMLAAGCTTGEIAGYFNVHKETLYNRCKKEHSMRFVDLREIALGKGNAIIRETQFNLAIENKDRVMLIWLGKQRLGQRENPESKEEFNGKLAELLKMLNAVNNDTESKSEADRSISEE